MKRRVVLVLLMLLLATSVFAQGRAWAKSYNKDGQFNLIVTAGYWWGVEGSVGLEFIITEFKIGNVPFDFGVAARGIFGYNPWWTFGADVWWAAGPVATLHMGLASIPIEFFISAGPAVYGATYSVYPVQFGFFSFNGVIWHLSPNFALVLEAGYGGYYGTWGFGIELKL